MHEKSRGIGKAGELKKIERGEERGARRRKESKETRMKE